MASGLPLAAFPVTEPFNALGGANVAFMEENLSKTVDQALQAPAKQARRHVEKYSWNACID